MYQELIAKLELAEKEIEMSRLSSKMKAISMTELYESTFENIKSLFNDSIISLKNQISEVESKLSQAHEQVVVAQQPIIAMREDLDVRKQELNVIEEEVGKKQKYIVWQEDKIKQNAEAIVSKRAELKLLLNDISLRENVGNSILSQAQKMISDSEKKKILIDSEYEKFISEKRIWETQRDIELQDIESTKRAYQLALEQHNI